MTTYRGASGEFNQCTNSAYPSGFCGKHSNADPRDTEIARLTRERDEALAKVAAAYEAVEIHLRDAEFGEPVLRRVRALTPADATAALNRVQAGAMREAAATPYGPRYTDDWLGMTCAILARADAVERGE